MGIEDNVLKIKENSYFWLGGRCSEVVFCRTVVLLRCKKREGESGPDFFLELGPEAMQPSNKGGKRL
jgi:hypothetical protein